jgi:(p)ppGpp synthase/HD superfamily hydrolase
MGNSPTEPERDPFILELLRYVDQVTIKVEAIKFAQEKHKDQKYGSDPYFTHLQAVADVVKIYGPRVEAIAYLHNVIEDTDATNDDLYKLFGSEIAVMVDLCTDPQGANRKEKKEKAYAIWSKLGPAWNNALIVKIADRLCNIRNCVATQDSRLQMYKDEHTQFKSATFRTGVAEELWAEIGSLIGKPATTLKEVQT